MIVELSDRVCQRLPPKQVNMSDTVRVLFPILDVEGICMYTLNSHKLKWLVSALCNTCNGRVIFCP